MLKLSLFFFFFLYISPMWCPGSNHNIKLKKTDKQSGNRDLFAWQLQADHKWLMNPLQTCTQLWPPYMSAGISLCEILGGKLQLPVLSRKKEKKNTLVTAIISISGLAHKWMWICSVFNSVSCSLNNLADRTSPKTENRSLKSCYHL